jgi:hypothetical protein
MTRFDMGGSRVFEVVGNAGGRQSLLIDGQIR